MPRSPAPIWALSELPLAEAQQMKKQERYLDFILFILSYKTKDVLLLDFKCSQGFCDEGIYMNIGTFLYGGSHIIRTLLYCHFIA